MKYMGGIICSLMLILTVTACSTKYEGSRIGNDSQLVMDYKIFNSTDSQSLVLKEGDLIETEIINRAGSLSVLIQKGENEPVYEGKNIPTNTFFIKIDEDGTYKITVKGEQAKGSVSFIKRTREIK